MVLPNSTPSSDLLEARGLAFKGKFCYTGNVRTFALGEGERERKKNIFIEGGESEGGKRTGNIVMVLCSVYGG